MHVYVMHSPSRRNINTPLVLLNNSESGGAHFSCIEPLFKISIACRKNGNANM